MEKFKVKLDHAAVATTDPLKLKKVLLLMGLTDAGSEKVESQGVITHFIRPQSSSPSVEILEVFDPKSTVAKFLEKKGAGIHHLSFMVDDVEALMAHLKVNNIRLVYDTAKPGAHNTRVNFIHPESTGGILLEISEKAK